MAKSLDLHITLSASCTANSGRISVDVTSTVEPYTLDTDDMFLVEDYGTISAYSTVIKYIQDAKSYLYTVDCLEFKLVGTTTVHSIGYEDFYKTTGINLTQPFDVQVEIGSPYSGTTLNNYLLKHQHLWRRYADKHTGYDAASLNIVGISNTSSGPRVSRVKTEHYFSGGLNFSIDSVVLTGNNYIVTLGDVINGFTKKPTSCSTGVVLCMYSDFKTAVTSTSLPTSNQTFSVSRRDADVKRLSQYYIKISVTATYTCDYGSSSVISTAYSSIKYDFYPQTDIVSASAPIALDAGNNTLFVNASNCLSSNMGYVPTRYVIEHNADTEPIITNSETGIESIPHTENRNVDVVVRIYYVTLEGVETYVWSDTANVDLRYISAPDTVTPYLSKIDEKDYSTPEAATEDKVKSHNLLTYKIPRVSTDIDAYDVVAHIVKRSDNSVHSFKVDKAINTHLDGYQLEASPKGFNGESFDNSDYGSSIRTHTTTANLTNDYPSPVKLKNKPISEFNIIQWTGDIDTSELSLLNPDAKNSETNPYIVETPEQFAYLCMGAGASEWASTTFGKYYKIKDGIDAFNMMGYDDVTLETTSAQLKLISSDGEYNIATARATTENNGWKDWRTLENAATTTKDGVPFAGTFDGNGCVIYNHYMYGNYPALFPNLGVGATLKNITMKACRSWNWRDIVDGTGSGLLYGNIDNGAAYADGKNPDYSRRVNKTTITIQNCAIIDCYANTFGDSKFLIGGRIRYHNMNISDCLCVDNILEVYSGAYCKSLDTFTSQEDLVAFGGLVGGSHIQGGTLNVNNCVVIGGTLRPLLNATPLGTQGLYTRNIVFDKVWDASAYKNCYTDTEDSVSNNITRLMNSLMRNSKASDFMGLDFDAPLWYTVNPTELTTISDDNLYINIDLSSPLHIYNEDGTTQEYKVSAKDIIYLEVRSCIYDNSAYHMNILNDDRYSLNALIQGVVVPVRIEHEDGTAEYRYGLVYVKTSTGYKEGSIMFIKNKNNYVEV